MEDELVTDFHFFLTLVPGTLETSIKFLVENRGLVPVL
jgi:hypothetical protein